MSKPLKLSEVVQPEFRTSEAASKKNEILAKNLGTHRYGPARLALALSLADKRPIKGEVSDVKGNSIRGRNLFGDSADTAAWMALITQHAGRELDRQAFSAAVAAHWERGIGILTKMWGGAGGDFDKFITALAEKSGMPEGAARSMSAPQAAPQKLSPPGAINLRLGEFTGTKRGQPAEWRINAPGHPPHIAVMGAPNTGKTRLALEFAESLHQQSGCAAFVFDMGKGDIAGNAELRASIGAEVITCPGTPIPLDILHVANRQDNTTIQNTAARLCDSVGFVTQGGRGPVQMNRLRQAAAQILAQSSDSVSMQLLRDAYLEENSREDSVSAALDRLCDFDLFVPSRTPENFFSHNWIFDLHDAAVDIQKFSAMMILDALNRHFAQLPDAPVDSDGNRQMGALLVIDEAHKILGFQHPALSDIIRLSRSKGGAVILISQSPNDYVREDANFIENIGLIASYQTNATQKSIKKVFSASVPLANLGKGDCSIRISGQSPQKIKVWG